MLESGIRLILEPAKSLQIETYQEIELLYLLEGEVKITSQRNNIVMTQNDVLVINQESICKAEALKQSVLCRLQIESKIFKDFVPEAKEKEFGFDCCSALAVNDRDGLRYEKLRQLLSELLYSYLQNGSQISFMQIGLCFQVLDHLTANFFTVETDNNTSTDEDCGEKRIRQVKKYVQENYNKQITLGELAKLLYVTESHLSRVVKKELGEGFREYLNRVRLRRAVADLMNTDKSVIRVANDNGFSGVTIFNKLFKEAYGITPSQLKKEQKEQKLQKGEATRQLEELNKKALNDTQAFLAQYNEKQKTRFKGIKAEIEVDAVDCKPYTKPWQNSINGGTMAELLNFKTQEHTIRLKERIGFTHIRLWGVFHSEMKVLPKNGETTFNFSKIDDVINFLLSNQIKPFFQLGPKPKLISRALGDELIKEKDTSIFSYDTEMWQNLLDKFTAHIVSRFGRKEVESWIFEMWSPCRWDGIWYQWYSEDKYFAVYNTIKKYVPNALIGTGEFSHSEHSSRLAEIVEQWRQNNAVPDFVSYTGFPYNQQGDIASMAKWITDENFLLNSVQQARDDLRACGLPDIKIYITTWNITISNRSILNDSVHKGAYIIKNALDVINNVELLCYWLCTDSYAEEYDSRELLFGGAGLLSKDGICKPSLYAFEFLNKLRSSYVKLGENYIVTAGRHGSFTIVYHNLKMLNYNVYLKSDSELGYEDLSHLFENLEPLTLQFNLSNLPEEVYDVRMQSVNVDSGSILDEWKRIGGYNDLQTEDRQYLARICVPKRDMLRKRTESGKINLELTVPPNAFGAIEIFPVNP